MGSRLVASALVSATLLAACSGTSSEQDQGALLDRIVAAGAPGALVVVRDGGAVRSAARGAADGRRPLHAHDRFRIGSITKTFVAALVLRLVEDGLLKLEDPVERWLPGLIPGVRGITVRQLLSHTSGCPTTSRTIVSVSIETATGNHASSWRSHSGSEAACCREEATRTRARTTSSLA
jgi:CubicO group peptidase (beta-lactamase class C family)